MFSVWEQYLYFQRIIDHMRLGGTLGGLLSNFLPKERSVLNSDVIAQIPQLLWSPVLMLYYPHEGKLFFQSLVGIAVLIYDRFSPFHCASAKKAWHHPIRGLKPSFLQAEEAQFLQSLFTVQVLQPQPSWWHSAELAPVYQYLSCTGQPKTGFCTYVHSRCKCMNLSMFKKKNKQKTPKKPICDYSTTAYASVIFHTKQFIQNCPYSKPHSVLRAESVPSLENTGSRLVFDRSIK